MRGTSSHNTTSTIRTNHGRLKRPDKIWVINSVAQYDSDQHNGDNRKRATLPKALKEQKIPTHTRPQQIQRNIHHRSEIRNSTNTEPTQRHSSQLRTKQQRIHQQEGRQITDFQRRHYIALADIIAQSADIPQLIDNITNYLRHDNYLFNETKFRQHIQYCIHNMLTEVIQTWASYHPYANGSNDVNSNGYAKNSVKPNSITTSDSQNSIS